MFAAKQCNECNIILHHSVRYNNFITTFFYHSEHNVKELHIFANYKHIKQVCIKNKYYKP